MEDFLKNTSPVPAVWTYYNGNAMNDINGDDKSQMDSTENMTEKNDSDVVNGPSLPAIKVSEPATEEVEVPVTEKLANHSTLVNGTDVEGSGTPKPMDTPLTPVGNTPAPLTPMSLASNNSSLSRVESYKDQRRKYRREKKRAAKELMSTLKDPSVVVLADWLKVRGSLKGWTKLWCVLKPGMLLLYKSSKAKSSHWCGTVLLNTCELIERPSKKDGFCFKLFHPLEQSIWATKGPQGESIGAVILPLPSSHLIFRAPSQSAGKCWMDAMELSMRCSSILLRSMTTSPGKAEEGDSTDGGSRWNEADIEKHFMDQDLDDASHTDDNQRSSCGHYTDTDSDDEDPPTSLSASYKRRGRKPSSEVAANDGGKHRKRGNSSVSSEMQEEEDLDEEEYDGEDEEEEVTETSYVMNTDDFVYQTQVSSGQQEVLGEENKSLIWHLVKQVRPGMDLSKVVLPTFILEPRSFLDKLSDYYYHADVLSKAVLEDDPFNRMKEVVRWYLSGFYKKPKGLKKPYNPILGETFRCYWRHPNGSRTFYVAEQVSHHPPVSALYIVNRQEGFALNATVLAKSKFYGNSTSAILDGCVRLCLLPRGEVYTMTMPYAHCKGILMGTLSMELGGKVMIECEKTGYSTEIEFKLRPFLSGYDANNLISGKLKLGKETLATLEGHWDTNIVLVNNKTGQNEDLWVVDQNTKAKRLPRYTVSPDSLGPTESERLWQLVSQAILSDDQVAATEEKSILEEIQRSGARERKAKCEDWIPKYFRQDPVSGEYTYSFSDIRPWDPRTDLYQYEYEYGISTKTRHKHLREARNNVATSQSVSLTASLISMDGGVKPEGVGVRLMGVMEGVSDSSSGGEGVGEVETVASTPVCAGMEEGAVPVSSVTSSLERLESTQAKLVTEVQALRSEVQTLGRHTSQTQGSAWWIPLLVAIVTILCQIVWSAIGKR